MKKKYLALLVSLAAVATLIFAFGCNPKATKLDGKKYDDVTFVSDSCRIVNKGGKFYLCNKSGSTLSKGYYALDVIDGKNLQYFSAALSPDSGLGILNAKGKLVTSLNSDKTGFQYGKFAGLSALYDQDDNAVGFLGKRSDNKYQYVGANDSTGGRLFDRILYETKTFFVGEFESGEGVSSYALYNAAGTEIAVGVSRFDFASTEGMPVLTKEDGKKTVYDNFGNILADNVDDLDARHQTFAVARHDETQYSLLSKTFVGAKVELGSNVSVDLASSEIAIVNNNQTNKKSAYALDENDNLSAILTDFDGITVSQTVNIAALKGDVTEAYSYIVGDRKAEKLGSFNASEISSSSGFFTHNGNTYAVGVNGNAYKCVSTQGEVVSALPDGATDASSFINGYVTFNLNGKFGFVSLITGIGAENLEIHGNNLYRAENGDNYDFCYIPSDYMATFDKSISQTVVYSAPKSDTATFTSNETTPGNSYRFIYGVDKDGKPISTYIGLKVMTILKDGKPVASAIGISDRGVFTVTKLDAALEGTPIFSTRNGVTARTVTVSCDNALAVVSYAVGADANAAANAKIKLTLLPGHAVKTVAPTASGDYLVGSNEQLLFGIWDADGGVILAPLYDSVTVCSDKAVVVEKDGRYAVVNPKGLKKDKNVTDFDYAYFGDDYLEADIIVLIKPDGTTSIFEENGKKIVSDAIHFDEITNIFLPEVPAEKDRLGEIYAKILSGKTTRPFAALKIVDKSGKTKILYLNVTKDNLFIHLNYA